MRAIAKVSGLVLAAPVLVVSMLAGCASSSAPSSPAAPPSPSGSAAPSSQAPSSPPASPQAPTPTPTVVSATVSYPWHWPNDANQPGQVGRFGRSQLGAA